MFKELTELLVDDFIEHYNESFVLDEPKSPTRVPKTPIFVVFVLLYHRSGYKYFKTTLVLWTKTTYDN